MQPFLQPHDWQFYVAHKGNASTLIVFFPVGDKHRDLSANEEDMILGYLTEAEHISNGIFEIDHNEDIHEELLEYGFEETQKIDPELLFILKSQTKIDNEDDIEIDSLTDKGMEICSSCGKCVYVDELDEFNECSNCRDINDVDGQISIEDFLY